MTIPTTGTRIPGPAGGRDLTLEAPLGGGAFGDVFLAREAETGTLYAVKFPRVAVFGDPTAVTAFMNEVMAAGRVVHPNVVRIVHAETAPAGVPPYVVMEYLPDGTLDARLRAIQDAGGQVSAEQFGRWASALVDAMNAINAEVLHRDLKPDNILMDGDTPKVGDFGLAKVVGAVTRSQTFKGGQHLLYMAPEGWRNETNTIQLDMYALGIVLYEIAAGRYPYRQPGDWRDVDAFRRMHFFEPSASLQNARPDLPTGYVHAITRLMQKRPEDRFKNWGEVRAALDNSAPSAVTTHPGVDALLALTQERHERDERERLAAAARAAEQREKLDLDLYMEGQLQERLDAAVAQFNAQSSLGRITTDWSALGPVRQGREISIHRVSLPFGTLLDWKGFNIEPPLALRLGRVRRAVTLKAGRGVGLHYLLCRPDDADLYGHWVACEVRVSALLNPQAEQGYFSKLPFDGPDEIREIERADHAMHVYTVEFPDDIQTPFLNLLRHMIQQRPGGR